MEKREIKDNWSTPIDREAMMWARVVSESLRRVCPEIYAGIYAPEEIEDFTDYDDGRVTSTVTPTAEEAARQQAEKHREAAEVTGDERDADLAEPIDADYTVTAHEGDPTEVNEDGSQTHPPVATAEPAGDSVTDDTAAVQQAFDGEGKPVEQPTAKASTTQLERMRKLREQLNVGPNKWDKTLSKRGVSVDADLTFVQAKEIIEAMEQALGN